MAVALAAFACHGSIGPDEVEGPFRWGGVENVTHLRHLWFAGQPDAAALERARDEGVGVVINLREPAEMEIDERALAEQLGLTYYAVPVAREGGFDPDAFERIEALVQEHHGEEILIHCSSSNRAGAWLAAHLVEQHGAPLDEALAVGRRTGITKPAIETKLRDYVARRAGAAHGESR